MDGLKQFLMDQWEALREGLVEFGPMLLKAVIIFIAGMLVSKIIRRIARNAFKRARFDDTLAGFLSNLAYMLLMAFVIIASLGALGIQTNSFTAIIAAAGLAIGFALQGSLGNFAAGVMCIAFRPYKIGDFIEGGGVTGTVEDIQVFSTILVTPDNKRVIVPNNDMMGGHITNYSTKPTRRVDMVFGIGYEDDIKKARDIMHKIVTAHPLVLQDPEPQIAVSELADSSVNFVVRPWSKTSDYWTVKFELTEQIKLAFDEQGISIPFPQTDVHLHQVA